MSQQTNHNPPFPTGEAALFAPRGRAPWPEVVPMALQHVVAMVVGCITMPMIVAKTAGVSGADTILMVQASLFSAALAILLQVFAFGGIVGSGLPVVVGSGFAFLPTLLAIVGDYGVPAMLGAQLIGAVLGILVGIFFRKIRFLFPPLVTACVVITIGISLYKTAINYMAGGDALAADYGSYRNWAVALVTLASVIFFGQFCKGILKITATLLGMLVGYLLALALGMISFDGLAQAGWFQLPRPLHFGLDFNINAILTLGIVFIVNAVQDIGQMEATASGGYGRAATDKEISGGVIANNISSLVGGFLGGVPVTTAGQNVGIVVTTKVVNRRVFIVAGGIVLVAAFMPKFSGLLVTIPQPVLGGATMTVFASIAMTGVRMLAGDGLSPRSLFIAGLSLAIALGISMVQGEFAKFPELFRSIFDQSPIVVVAIFSILLNLIIPKDKPKTAEPAAEKAE